MTDVIAMIDPVTGELIDEQQLAEQLLKQAKEQGLDLVGPDGLLNGWRKRALRTFGGGHGARRAQDRNNEQTVTAVDMFDMDAAETEQQVTAGTRTGGGARVSAPRSRVKHVEVLSSAP